MTPLVAVVAIAGAATLTVLATWALCVLADDPPEHCDGCRCGLPGHHYAARPAVLYDYEQDPAYRHPTAS